MSTEVSIIIGSQKFTGWTSASIRRSIETLANTFQLGLLDVWEDSLEYRIKPGDACKVKIGEETVITGFIDSIAPDISGEDYTISVSGRCKCGDLVDCSAMNSPGSWNRPVGLQKLVYELVKPFGLRVHNKAETVEEDIKNFSLDSGQSPFDAIRQACEMRAVLAISNTDGDIVLTNVGRTRSHDALAYGYNIIQASAKYDFADRFSQYTVKGSSSSDGDGWGSKSTTSISGVANDSEIKRYRPKLLIADSGATNKTANTRAAWEAHVRAARSAEIVVTIAGWRQSNGSLWRENELVLVDVAPLRINQAEMLIAQVSYIYDDNGEIVELLLRRPDAYAPNPPKKVKQQKKTGIAGWE
jgi:prophage tail gpP-like protein